MNKDHPGPVENQNAGYIGALWCTPRSTNHNSALDCDNWHDRQQDHSSRRKDYSVTLSISLADMSSLNHALGNAQAHLQRIV